MDFTERPMRGFVFGGLEELDSEKDLEFWLELALAYNAAAAKFSKFWLNALIDRVSLRQCMSGGGFIFQCER